MRARRRVERAFEEWAAKRGMLPSDDGAVDLWRDRIKIVLQGREDHLRRPDPTLWRSGDVHRLLIDHLVPQQTDAWGLAEHGVDTVREYLRFLDDTGRLHPGSTRVVTLLRELDRAASKFGAAMADSSRFRLAKRVWTAMRGDGLDIDSDTAEIDRWAERFSALDAQGRRRVLGELMDHDPRFETAPLVINGGQVAMLTPGMPPDKTLVWPGLAPCDCGCADAVSAPAPELPARTELTVAVAASETLRRLSALAEWVGEQGRPVDRHGELPRKDVAAMADEVGVPGVGAKRLRDVPALATLWDLAHELDVLSLRHTRVIRGETAPVVRAALRSDGVPGQALDLWDEVFDELVHPDSDAATPEQEQLRDWMQPWVPHMLGKLYREFAAREFVDVMWLVDEVVAERTENGVSEGELLDTLAVTTLLRGLSVLDELGAVEVDDPVVSDDVSPARAAALQVVGMAPWMLSPPDRLRVRLTDLGRRGVYLRLARENGLEPVVGAASV